MPQDLGRQVIVENEPSAGSTIEVEYVKAAEPDGHTLLPATSSTPSFLPHVKADAPYSIADFAAAQARSPIRSALQPARAFRLTTLPVPSTTPALAG